MVNAVAPFKTVKVKNNRGEWFDGEIEDTYARDKPSRRFKLTKLHVDKKMYKEAQNVI